MPPFQFVVEKPGLRLDLFLSRQTGESRAFVQRQIDLGRVSVNGQTASRAAVKLRAGDKVTGTFAEDRPRLELCPIPGELSILYEDEAMLVINKSQGVVVHPASGHRGATLVHHLLYHLRASTSFTETSASRPGIVHRLDRGTSGVLVVAKHRRALESLAAQFKLRQTEKTYEAIVWGKMRKEKGVFRSPIGRDPKDRKRMSSRAKEPRDAWTEWQAEELFAHFTHVTLFPKTGRTHQLRVHLFESHHPIVGDDLYGRRPRGLSLAPPVEEAVKGVPQTLLHAKQLTLSHPTTGKRLSFSAPPPALFDSFLKTLKEWDR